MIVKECEREAPDKVVICYPLTGYFYFVSPWPLSHPTSVLLTSVQNAAVVSESCTATSDPY